MTTYSQRAPFYNAISSTIRISVTCWAYDFLHAALALHRARGHPRYCSLVLGWRVHQPKNEFLAIRPLMISVVSVIAWLRQLKTKLLRESQ